MGYSAERGGLRPLRDIQEHAGEMGQPVMYSAPYRRPVIAEVRAPMQIEVTDPATNHKVLGYDAASHPAFMSAPVKSHWVVQK
ncbi:hypothetical protein A3F02_03505 [Candidatus Curtissbacteria bacterium RIFCSPHIGHO2_12_FULL_38_9b]|uniref:Uncharacterized protein n=1 Tax=Candidatus Curtissbacteria bacterium RIFCSPHIGHO2_12_FULL_38_9b TaxID=1797720 RepID=A0A1F5GWG8_9BACT|nr:MAG: hypothetical protein A3F02_03505 [Candidatus Curtissbacteria bacterium RIFCSPHIGHO2_12_FULL_38_9b]